MDKALSPPDLYAQERIAAWLWQRRLVGYGEVFPRLPTAVAGAWSETVQDPRNGHALYRPVSDADWQRLKAAALEQHAFPQLYGRIANRKGQLDRLAKCPDCSQRATTFEPSPPGFFALCNSCGCQWELRDRRFCLTMNALKIDRESQGFRTYGHRWLCVEITRS